MHPWLGSSIPTLVLLHVVSAFFFALLHGPSAYAMWSLRVERDGARVGALLDLSNSASPASWLALAALATTGALLAAAQHTWGAPWVWGSIVVLVAVSLSMSLLASRPFNHARSAAGLAWFDGKGMQAATGQIDREALDKALATIRSRAPIVLAIGAVGLAALVALMVQRPG